MISLFSLQVEAANYTWTGNKSTAWATDSNWTPVGVPNSSDNVTIVTSSNIVKISAVTAVSDFTMTSGSFDLQGNSFTTSSIVSITGGTISNGKLYLNCFSATFGTATISAWTSVNCSGFYLNGATFNDSLKITKTGGSTDVSKGGNTFNGYVSMLNTSAISGYVILSDSLSDTFNGNLQLESTGGGRFLLAHRGTNNIFNGDVVLKGGYISSNQYGNAYYNGNVYVSNTNTSSGSSIYFGITSGSATITSGKTISILSPGITVGGLYFKNFNILDSTNSVSLTITSPGTVLFFDANSIVKAPLTVSAPGILVNQSRFYNTASFTKTSSGTNTSTGKNYFARNVSFTNSGSGTLALASTYKDTFMLKGSFISNGGIVNISNGLFNDSAYFKNSTTASPSTSYVNIATSGNSTFKGNVSVENTTAIINFSSGDGTTTLDSTSSLNFNSGSSGTINLKNFTKKSSSAVSASQPSLNVSIGPAVKISGKFTLLASQVAVLGTTFYDTTSITRIGGGSNWDQGNVFYKPLTFKDSSSSTRTLTFNTSSIDTFYSDVKYSFYGPLTAKINYARKCYYFGNMTVESNGSTVTFGQNAGGRAIFKGNQNAAIKVSTSGAGAVTFNKMELAKSSGIVTLQNSIKVVDTLTFSKGVLVTDTNSIILSDNCKSLGASDTSFVEGNVKKLGDDVFTFPVGNRSNYYGYHPITMTAPTSTSDAYTAKYFAQGQLIGSALDTSIEHLNSCQYWKLIHDAGTSKVRVTLNWNYDTCNYSILNPTYMRVVGWDGVKWKNYGNSSFFGDSLRGKVTSFDSSNTASNFTLANKKCIYYYDQIEKQDISCKDRNDGRAAVVVKGGTRPYNYEWSNGLGIDSLTPGILHAGRFNVTVTDNLGCKLADSINIYLPENLEIITSTVSSFCQDSTGEISLNVNGGTGPKTFYWLHDGSNSSHVSNVPSGEYTVLISDSVGCTEYKDIFISDSSAMSINISEIDSANCFGENNGMVKVDVTNSTSSPFQYKWSTSFSDTTDLIKDVGAGNYNLRVTDSQGCIAYKDVEILQPEKIKIELDIINSICGQSSGSVTAIVAGSTGNINYKWSVNESTSGSITNQSSGEGIVTIEDSKGCRASKNYEILDKEGILVSGSIIHHAICFPDSGGSAFVTVTNGSPPYRFTWFPNGGEKDTAANLFPGIYTVTVVDNNGCRQKTDITIASPPKLELYMDVTRPSTDSSNDGSITPIVFGGTPPYSYLWSNFESTKAIYGLTLEMDTLTVTDANGCRVSNVANTNFGHGGNGLCDRFANIWLPSTCTSFPAITQTSVNIVTDFGAVGDGLTNDQCAFESACAYLSSLPAQSQKSLIIPARTYIVGRQEPLPGSGFYLMGNAVIGFDNIENLTIFGLGLNGDRPILKFEDCMKYGSFDVPNNPDNRYLTCDPCIPSGNDYSHVATPGQIIHIHKGNNIVIQNLVLEGNFEKCRIGGPFPNGIAYDGIFLNACFNVSINNVDVQNFGHDGIWINFDYCLDPSLDITPWFWLTLPMHCNISNTRCLYNGRNGLTWAGGNGLNVYKSEFSWSGQNRMGGLDPWAGIDIEFENSWVGNSNGIFNRIKCKYNLVRGMTCDAGYDPHRVGGTDLFTRHQLFTRSIFVGAEDNSVSCVTVVPNSRDFTFQLDTFVGQMHKAYRNIWTPFILNAWGVSASLNPNTNTKFLNCRIWEEYADPNIQPVTIRSFANTPDETCATCPPCPVREHQPLVDFENSMNVLFDLCTFESYYTMRWIKLSTGSGGLVLPWVTQPNYNIMSSCSLINRGINMCGCPTQDAFLGVWKQTDFQPATNIVIGLNGLNNQPPTGGCGVTWNEFDAWLSFNNNLNTQNIVGDTHGSPACINHDPLLWGTQPPLRPKFKNPIIPDLVTVWNSCPNCSTSVAINCTNKHVSRLPSQEESEESSIITISPNPASDYLNIENIGSGQLVHVFNAIGNVEILFFLKEGSQNLFIGNLDPGVYIIQTKTAKSYKFVKL